MEILDIALGVFFGTSVIWVILLAPKFPIWFRRIRGRIHVWRYFRKQRTGVMFGFGLTMNGVPVMNNNEPLLFETPAEAKEHATKRGFYKETFVSKFRGVPNAVHVIWQEWDLEELQMTWGEVRGSA